ncbi:MAG: hypothetical protein EP338_04385 [Bacteroidetes bacterium]|nr:MAG: hypothetical protein EP338_04385 [Bacteroidota bacterium]
MKKIVKTLLVASCLYSAGSFAQPIMQWHQTLPDAKNSFGINSVECTDGSGFLTASYDEIGGGFHQSHITKVNNQGEFEWRKSYGTSGGTNWPVIQNVPASHGGGYIMVANSTSNGQGWDYFVVKLKEDFTEEWSNFYGGNGNQLGVRDATGWNDHQNALIVVPGGFVLLGHANSNPAPGTDYDAYLMMIDNNGVQQWEKYENFGSGSNNQRYYGGSYNATTNRIVLQGRDLSASPQWNISEVDLTGNTLSTVWSNNFSGRLANFISDGSGYLFKRTQNVGGNTQVALRKVDHSGNTIWANTFGGNGYDNVFGNIEETPDGGFVAAGETVSSDLDNQGSWDHYLLKVNGDGSFQWQVGFGGTQLEWLHSVLVTSDGGYLTTGLTRSFGAPYSLTHITKFGDPANRGTIEGLAYRDENGNNSFDGDDLPISNLTITATDGSGNTYITKTDEDGNYALEVAGSRSPGIDYTITHGSTGTSWINNDAHTVSAITGATSSQNDFAFVANGPVPPCSATGTVTTHAVAGVDNPCPNGTLQYCITIDNNAGTSAIPTGASITVSLDELANVTLASGSAIIQNIDLAAGEFTFTTTEAVTTSAMYCFDITYTNFDPAVVTSIGGSISISYSSQGQQCTLTFPITAEPTDCAFDPNDMVVSPAGCGPNGNVNMDQDLTYQIRFENTGTGTAHNIYITDYLDENLDPSTFELVSSSHEITSMQVNNYGHLVFTLANVQLPAVQFAPDNKGYIKFKISPKAGLAEGTEISNYAGIVFDFNLPIYTNEVINTLYSNATPSADFSFNYSNAALSWSELDFIASETDADVDFTWDFGTAATPSTGANASEYNVAFEDGFHTVSLTADKNGCVVTTSQEIMSATLCAPNKVLICQNGNTICVNANAIQGLIDAGAELGSCGAEVASIEINASPNPFNNILKVEFNVLEDGNTILEVRNHMGVLMGTYFSENVNAGDDYKVNIPTNKYDTGIYEVILVTPSETKTITVVKIN